MRLAIKVMHHSDKAPPKPLVSVSPDWLGGEPVFTGRRVPVQALFAYLKSDQTLQNFLDDYPSVSRAHAIAVIEWAQKSILRAAPDA